MCTTHLTHSISLPFFPVCLLSFSFVVLLSKWITHSVATNYRFRARNHFIWSSDSSSQPLNPEIFNHFVLGITEGLRIRRYEHAFGSCERVKCMVCLCLIEEGEEIRELRCEHLFHRVCLDRWLAYQHATCPLCRSSLFPSKTAAKQAAMETEEDPIYPFSSFLTGTNFLIYGG